MIMSKMAERMIQMAENNDSDERVYLEGLSYLFDRYLFLPLTFLFIIFLLMAMAGCVLRQMNGA